MNTISIDFGLAKVGIGIAYGPISEPYSTIRYKNNELLFKTVKEILEKEKIQKIIVGISEGQMAIKTREFIEELKKETKIPVEEFDETLSTQEAQIRSIEAGMKRSKRKSMEDAIAAAIMLQNYLDESEFDESSASKV
jgi:putative holliday junction resolvase